MGKNLKLDEIIYPYFVRNGAGIKEEIRSFPGQYRFSIDRLIEDISGIRELGLNKILLFGIPLYKDFQGSAAYEEGDIISQAVRQIKAEFRDMVVMTDVCLCSYTDHGHCGILKDGERTIDNKATLKTLSEIALVHARAGADWVAPSAMAKRQVAAIRKRLDENGLSGTKIMGYSAKFASSFYGPFRNAADSSPRSGYRKAYQLDYTDTKRALKEIEDDIREGADIVMVKPAVSYLDIIRQAAEEFSVPVAAYNTSGEYAFVKYGARMGLWGEKEAALELLSSIKRAGASLIITYHAKEAAEWLRKA